jgi:hypothetical protein
MKRLSCSRQYFAQSGEFSPELRCYAGLQTHSCLRPLHKVLSGHPDVGQRKQGDELRRVFLQPAVAHFGATELALDDSERMFHLSPHTGLELFSLLHSIRMLLAGLPSKARL